MARVVSWWSIEGGRAGVQGSLGVVSLRFGRICQSMSVFWGCWKICRLKTREIAKATDKCESPVRRGLLTPLKRATGGLLFPGVELAFESAQEVWRPSVGGFGGVGRHAPNKKGCRTRAIELSCEPIR